MSQLEITAADRPFGGHGGSFPIAADVINANGLAGADSPFTAHRAKLSISGPSAQVTCLVAVDGGSPIELVASDHPEAMGSLSSLGRTQTCSLRCTEHSVACLVPPRPLDINDTVASCPGSRRPAVNQSDLGQNARGWRRWRGPLTRCCAAGGVSGHSTQTAKSGLRHDH